MEYSNTISIDRRMPATVKARRLQPNYLLAVAIESGLLGAALLLCRLADALH